MRWLSQTGLPGGNALTMRLAVVCVAGIANATRRAWPVRPRPVRNAFPALWIVE